MKQWSTFIEALVASKLASGWGKAPSTAPFWEIVVWPMVATHNMVFSIVNNGDYQHPIDESDAENVVMASRLVDAWLGCFIHPIYGTPDGRGSFVHDYPASMINWLVTGHVGMECDWTGLATGDSMRHTKSWHVCM